MTRVRVESFTVSLDGFGAGTNRGVENPLGVGGKALHDSNTTFHWVTGGIHGALDQARKAADGMDVRIGGEVNTIQQYTFVRA